MFSGFCEVRGISYLGWLMVGFPSLVPQGKPLGHHVFKNLFGGLQQCQNRVREDLHSPTSFPFFCSPHYWSQASESREQFQQQLYAPGLVLTPLLH